MRQKLTSLKNVAYQHRAKIAVAATLSVVVAFELARGKQWNEFLEEHNLTAEFYKD